MRGFARRPPAEKAVPHLLAHHLRRLGPGVALCLIVTGAACLAQLLEAHLAGQAYVEALVLAILLGTVLRTAWKPGPRWQPGISFSAKFLLEVAVMLLGATISLHALIAAGLALFFGIVGVVAVAIAVSYGICRLLGLTHHVSVLVACGNSICGNSAIAAVAPVIGAGAEDIAAAIAFTAILGVAVVLGLPFAVPLIGLSHLQYGVLAGLTVYAVPQVLAATLPVAAVSAQIGTLVKLVRVLMLGPVVLALSLAAGRKQTVADEIEDAVPHLPFHRLVPWFILGFLAMAGLRAAGAVPAGLLPPIAALATALTILSMAALGLGVDMRVLGRVGARVTLAVTASLFVLIGIALGLIRLLGLA